MEQELTWNKNKHKTRTNMKQDKNRTSTNMEQELTWNKN